MELPTAKVSLPGHLFPKYESYKASTGVILKWLNANGGLTFRTNGSVPVNDVLQAAENVHDNKTRVPKGIHSAFKSTLKFRQAISAFYESAALSKNGVDMRSIQSHAHFTKTLFDAYNILFPGDLLLPSHTQQQATHSDLPIEKTNKNFYEALAQLTDDSNTNEPYDNVVTSYVTQEEQSPHHTAEIPYIEDDDYASIMLAYDVHSFLKDLATVSEIVQSFWAEAGDGSLPIPLAAWLTNVAFNAMIPRIEHKKTLPPDAEHLYNKYKDDFVDTIEESGSEEECEDLTYNYFRDGYGLGLPSETLRTMRDVWTTDAVPEPPKGPQKPPEYIHSPRQQPMENDIKAFTSVIISICNMMEAVPDEKIWRDQLRSPLAADLEDYLESSDPTEDPDDSLAFGMHLFTESYRSFLWKGDEVNKTNCRLKSLQFARNLKGEVHKSLTQFDEEWSRTSPGLIFELRELDQNLERYLKDVRFDLYYQAPWTAGSHMANFLSSAMDLGLAFCTNEGSLGAFLHVYNALRQMECVESIPLLEDICTIFTKEVFLGTRPKTSFSNCFRLFLGGKRQKRSKGEANSASTGNWSVAFPKSKDFKERLVPKDISLLYYLHWSKSRVTKQFSVRMWTDKNPYTMSPEDLDNLFHFIVSQGFTGLLMQLRDVLFEELAGELPVARINYFALHRLAIDTLENTAEKFIEAVGEEHSQSKFNDWFGIVDEMLLQITQHQREDRENMVPNLALVTFAKNAFTSFVAGKTLEDVCWKF